MKRCRKWLPLVLLAAVVGLLATGCAGAPGEASGSNCDAALPVATSDAVPTGSAAGSSVTSSAATSAFSLPDDYYNTFGGRRTTPTSDMVAAGIDLIVPEYIIIANIGDTYQLTPESTGVACPRYEYRSSTPEYVLVNNKGLVTLEGYAGAEIYVTLVDADTDEEIFTQIVTVVSGSSFNSESSSSQ